MPDDAVASLNCTQCGGELHPAEGELFMTCPYCGATVYVDKSQVVFHWFLAPTLNDGQAAEALARWMSGNQTVKDLDKKSQVVGQSFEYFPVWFFKILRGNQETLVIQPAAATSITEVRRLSLPAGDLRPYDSSVDAKATQPTVPLEAARTWATDPVEGGEFREAALVHIPVYIFKYLYKNQAYTALVEAGTGAVLANIFPAKAEAPYYMAAGITAAVYLFLAVLALVGGPLLGGAPALIIGLVAAPFLFILAVMVASKV